MADHDVEKIKKIVSMLSSEHEGEAAAAARMLCVHAKKQNHSILEMMAAVFGGGGSGASLLQRKLNDALHTVEIAKQAVAVALARAEEEKAKRIALERHRDAGFTASSAPREDRSAFWAQAEQAKAQASGWNDPPWKQQAPPPPNTSSVHVLREMFDQYGVSMLTPWEQQFVTDLIDRGIRHPSEKQAVVIMKLVAKYRQWEGLSNFGFHSVGR